MDLIRRMQTRIAASGSNDRGMAVPIVLTVMIIGLGFSAAAVTAAVSAQSGTNHDQDSKDALAIADAGAQRALLNKNKIEAPLAQPCVVKDSNGNYVTDPLPSATSPWCTSVGGPSDPDAQVGDGYFTYRVMPCGYGTTGTGCTQGPNRSRLMKVVSEGYQDGVIRRVAITASGIAGSVSSNFPAAAIGKDGVSTDGSSTIYGDVATNGNVTMNGASKICGDIQVGSGKNVNGQQCGGSYTVSQGNLTLPPVKIDSSVCATPSLPWPVCDDVRLTSGLDPITGSVSWDPATRTLSMSGNATVTLGGTDYSFCRLDAQGNSQLIMAAGAHVRLFFDSPENCGLSSPATQIDVTGSFTSTSWDPASGSYDLPIIYMLGSTSGSIATEAQFWGNADSQFQLYAPNTDVNMGGSATYWGTVAGKTLNTDGNAELRSDPNVPPPVGDPNFVLYTIRTYVECGPQGTTPDANC
jgi:hypothetical protein